MSDLDEYIYVGTGRNIPYNIVSSFNYEIVTPMPITPEPVENSPEIWRYKKNNSKTLEKVYTVPDSINVTGIRYMITHKPFNGNPYLYAASYGGPITIFKSTNGVNWFPLEDNILKGNSSRAMVTFGGKIYISTIDEANQSSIPQLYSSVDPEYYPWTVVIDAKNPYFNRKRNPI